MNTSEHPVMDRVFKNSKFVDECITEAMATSGLPSSRLTSELVLGIAIGKLLHRIEYLEAMVKDDE